MRRILVEQARRKARHKHGGDRKRLNADEIDIPIEPPAEDVLALDEALERLRTRALKLCCCQHRPYDTSLILRCTPELPVRRPL